MNFETNCSILRTVKKYEFRVSFQILYKIIQNHGENLKLCIIIDIYTILNHICYFKIN